MRIKWILSFCLWSMFAVHASAESKMRVHRIDVRLSGDSCGSAPNRIFIVLDDRDGETLPADRSGSVWRWEGEPVEFDPLKGHASIRFPGVRTRCRRPDDWVENESRIGVATFNFPSCSIGAVDVTMAMSTSPAIGVSYVRKVDPDDAQRGAPCREGTAFLSDEKRRFLGFWPGPENLSLYLTKRKGQVEGKALPLNALIEKYPGSILQKGKAIGPNRVAFIWQLQDARGDASGPALSPNAIDIYVKKLDDVHFKSLTLTVN